MSDIASEKAGKSLLGWNLADWNQAYRNGANASELLNALRAEVHQQESRNGVLKEGSVWIELASEQQLGAQLMQLQQLLDAADGDMQALPFAAGVTALSARVIATARDAGDAAHDADAAATLTFESDVRVTAVAALQVTPEAAEGSFSASMCVPSLVAVLGPPACGAPPPSLAFSRGISSLRDGSTDATPD